MLHHYFYGEYCLAAGMCSASAKHELKRERVNGPGRARSWWVPWTYQSHRARGEIFAIKIDQIEDNYDLKSCQKEFLVNQFCPGISSTVFFVGHLIFF